MTACRGQLCEVGYSGLEIHIMCGRLLHSCALYILVGSSGKL
jgi:hypothetical protein